MGSPKNVSRAAADKTGRTAILAVDYGKTRIGLAIADTEARLSQPLGTLRRVNRNEDMRRLRELAREHGVRHVVVGLPLRLDGTRGEMAEEVEGFAQRVRKQIGLPVELVDERLTSWEAERVLEEEFGRVRSRATQQNPRHGELDDRLSVDSVAAAIILREYFGRYPSIGKNVKN